MTLFPDVGPRRGHPGPGSDGGRISSSERGARWFPRYFKCMRLGQHSVKAFFAGRRQRRKQKREDEQIDDLEQQKDLLKRIAAGFAMNKPPHW